MKTLGLLLACTAGQITDYVSVMFTVEDKENEFPKEFVIELF